MALARIRLLICLSLINGITSNSSIKVDVSAFAPRYVDLEINHKFQYESAIAILTTVRGDTKQVPVPAESTPVIPFRTPKSDQQQPEAENFESQEKVHLSALYSGKYNHWSIDIPRYGEADVEKTLCSNALSHSLRTENISLNLMTSTSQPVTVEVKTVQTKYVLGLDEEVEVDLHSNSAKVFQFLPDKELYNYGEEKDETYLVSVKSVLNSSSNCLYVAINPPGCPWYDSVDLVRNSRVWARMLSVGYYPVRAEAFPKGFIISIVPVENNSECTNLPSNHTHRNLNKLLIKVEKTLNSYVKPIGLAFGLVLMVGVGLLAVVLFIWKINMDNLPSTDEEPKTVKLSEYGETEMIEQNGAGDAANQDGDEGNDATHQNEEESQERRVKYNREMSPWTPENSYRHHLINDIWRVYDERSDNKSDHCLHAVERLKKKKLFLSDMTLMKDNPWHRRQRSKTYLYLVPLVSIFYLIPSAQMVYTEHLRSRETGNLEQCYLNYGCSRPYGILTDFNHVISNVGYWIYGSAFVLLVFLKSKLLPEGHRPHEDHSASSGPLQQHSIFYTMGICLILQGIFSAIFHICPSNISLQFDTTIMYIMMILVFIKIFQLRHPDTSYNAYHTIYIFAVVLVFEALSLYIFNSVLRFSLYALFVIFYLCLMIHIAVDIYYYGAIKTSKQMIPIIIQHAIRFKGHVLYKRKFFLTSAFITINLCLLIFIMYRTFKEPGKSLSTPLLIIGGTNVGMYLVYYFTKKLQEICHNDFSNDPTVPKMFMRLLSFIFFGAALVVGIIAAFFYSRKHQSRNSTPPESRNKNEVCNFLDFFDNHDLWHFTSATSLFLAFIGLLIIDDDLLFINRDDIPVF